MARRIGLCVGMLVTAVPAGMPSPIVRVGSAEVTVVVSPFVPVVTVVYTVGCALFCACVKSVDVAPVILAGKELAVGPPGVCTIVVVMYVFRTSVVGAF